MKPLPAPWKPVGEVFTSAAIPSRKVGVRTTTAGFAGDGDGSPSQHTAKSEFNFGRHKWLCRVVRDQKLPGAAIRVAVLLWELQSAVRAPSSATERRSSFWQRCPNPAIQPWRG